MQAPLSHRRPEGWWDYEMSVFLSVLDLAISGISCIMSQYASQIVGESEAPDGSLIPFVIPGGVSTAWFPRKLNSSLHRRSLDPNCQAATASQPGGY